MRECVGAGAGVWACVRVVCARSVHGVCGVWREFVCVCLLVMLIFRGNPNIFVTWVRNDHSPMVLDTVVTTCLVFRRVCHSHHIVRRYIRANNFEPQTFSCWPLCRLLFQAVDFAHKQRRRRHIAERQLLGGRSLVSRVPLTSESSRHGKAQLSVT